MTAIKKTLPFLLSISIIFLLFSCEKREDSIVGKWEWIMSDYGDFGFLKTPENVDSTFYVDFDEQGIYYLLNNSGNQILTAFYKLGISGKTKTITLIMKDSTELTNGFTITDDILKTWSLYQANPVVSSFKRVN